MNNSEKKNFLYALCAILILLTLCFFVKTIFTPTGMAELPASPKTSSNTVQSSEPFSLCVPYELDGISVYEYPMNSRNLFSVDTIIYYSPDGESLLETTNDSSHIITVSNITELSDAISSHPFAAIIMKDTMYTTEVEDFLYEVSSVCYPILILEITTSMTDKTSSEYQCAANLMKRKGTELFGSNFGSYILAEDSTTSKFLIYQYSIRTIATFSDLLEFCNDAKNNLFIRYGQRRGEIVNTPLS
ncbi:MAG: hypothetical protein MSB10_00490 [Clostridiales bacterium]|nr:hypothetical protein [Clostridiales bacterium]